LTSILAIDTSSAWCSVALSLNESAPLVRHQKVSAGASQLLLPWIEELLLEANTLLKDLDAIAIGVGPGAFTGVRLGVAAVQGLAFAAKLPVLPICSLDAIAVQLSRTAKFNEALPQNNTPFVVAVDARMGEIYWARYESQLDALPKRTSELMLSPPELVDLHGTQFVAGSAIVEFGDRLLAQAHPALTSSRMDSEIGVHALGVLMQGQQLLEEGKQIDVHLLEPLYVRNKVALTTLERENAFGA
jgi:tRNA threonylcarbamoyladenosine biosynthesis protein TsaB